MFKNMFNRILDIIENEYNSCQRLDEKVIVLMLLGFMFVFPWVLLVNFIWMFIHFPGISIATTIIFLLPTFYIIYKKRITKQKESPT